MRYIYLMLLIWLLVSCKKKQNEVNETRDEIVYRMLFENESIKKQLITLFGIDNMEKPKVFKVLIARHDSYARVTIHQLFYEFEKEELPLGIVSYNKSLFLYYNGEELIFNNHIDNEELERRLLISSITLEVPTGSIKDSRVLQFDVDLQNKVRLIPSPIAPFDERSDYIKFKNE